MVRERAKTELEQLLDETRGHGWRKWLAAELGVSRVALHKWITGRAPWPEDRVVQVCVVLGVERDGLFEEVVTGGEGPAEGVRAEV